MLKHLVVNSYGVYLGLKSARLVVKKDGELIKEYPLKNLKTISIKSRGVGLSSDLAYACGVRGVKIFFNDFKSHLALHTLHEHKSVNVIKHQILSEQNGKDLALAKELIIGKIKNQRSTILYFSRYLQDDLLKQKTTEQLKTFINELKTYKMTKDSIFGIEGSAAKVYFDYLRQTRLLGDEFVNRMGRYADDNVNKALNYGYAILLNIIYKSVINAGLNPYFGVLHSLRSAKPSLVLDIMEEYRSFLVDRNIIKLRHQLKGDFNECKKLISNEIFNSLAKKLPHNHSKLSLESIIQRQVYKLSGFLCGANNYHSYVFRW
ncbi:CRISPR-associated endonuclease Cas1 [Campylobacter sp. RM12647]|uniref:CRISPR-associated endonuclease Cas1 n=1 Tax=Campylobacter sp. RM12647 TaxID=2735737 RepID=UPI001DA40F03|nr:CRISPR-associated endonuclease Cas1 [Campylobacter sp. RM12647]